MQPSALGRGLLTWCWCWCPTAMAATVWACSCVLICKSRRDQRIRSVWGMSWMCQGYSVPEPWGYTAWDLGLHHARSPSPPSGLSSVTL